MGQQYSTNFLKIKTASEKSAQLLQLNNSWEEALKWLASIPINETSPQCLIASGYADALIGSVRGILRHLEENDPINAFRIMRTTLECLVKFKLLINDDDSFLEKLKDDLSYHRKRLFNRAKNQEKGVGLEILKSAYYNDIDFNKTYPCLNFEDLCKQIGWLQPYNLIYWHTSSVSHVGLDQVLSTFAENTDESFEIKPHGESSHDQDFQLALNLMEWLEEQFSKALVEFENLQQ